MSINGAFVLDSVVHGFDSTAANVASRYGKSLLLANFGFQWAMVPEPYRLAPLRYFQTIDADVLEWHRQLSERVARCCEISEALSCDDVQFCNLSPCVHRL